MLRNIFLMGAASLALMGCGVSDGISERCGDNLAGVLCKLVFGKPPPDLGPIQSEQDRLAREQIELEKELYEALFLLQEDLRAEIAAGRTDMESQLRAVDIRLAELAERDTIVGFIDPCGDGSGYDEVILLTSAGDLVAYFETGGSRFLTLLRQGTFVTTDQQRCRFTVSPDGVVSW